MKKEKKLPATTKVFVHNKKLDKELITFPYDKHTCDLSFYDVNKDDLLEFGVRESRLAQYLFPNPNVSDSIIMNTIMKTIHAISKYVAGRYLDVQFTQLDTASSANFQGTRLNISLGPLFDHRLPFYARLNSIVGVSFHEACHARYTTPGAAKMLIAGGHVKKELNKFGKKLDTVPDFNKLSELFNNGLHHILMNIVEDRRIESRGLKEFPGYVFYMDELRTQGTWLHKNSMADPANKSDYSDQMEYWNALTRYIMYKVLTPELLPDFDKVRPTDSKFVDLMSKVDEIVENKAYTFEEAYKQSVNLLKLYPEEQQKKQPSKGSGSCDQPMQGPEGSDYNKELGEKITELIEALVKENDSKPQKREHEVDRVLRHEGNTPLTSITIHPIETKVFNDKIYREALEVSHSISRNLSFLDSRFNRVQETYELRSGELDESEIHALQFNKDIFFDEEEAPGYSMDLGVLIDESGSMGGRDKIRQAQVAALALAIALRHNEHINLFVYGHTANDEDDEPISMFQYIDPIERQDNINGLFEVHARSNNADGYAIAKMGEIVSSGKSNMKVLIVISDGQPAAYGYGGHSAEQHVREMVTRLEQKNMFVVQICVDDVRDSEKMFTHYIKYDKNDLGKNLKKVLMKKLIEISNTI